MQPHIFQQSAADFPEQAAYDLALFDKSRMCFPAVSTAKLDFQENTYIFFGRAGFVSEDERATEGGAACCLVRHYSVKQY